MPVDYRRALREMEAEQAMEKEQTHG
jgi:hypothetical protein